jgi:alpha-beta hydrolase superfamily lysophospholipase
MGDEPLNVLGPFNDAFEPARTPYDWLSRDPAEVDAYLADPFCGDDMPLSHAYAAGVFGLVGRETAPEAIAALPAGLPVLVLNGERDPVGGSAGSQVAALVDALRARGLPVEQHVYPDARHEVFNETNRDEVTADLLAWLDGRLG